MNIFAVTPATELPPQVLDPVGSWPQAVHLWSAPELDALALAVATGRPLLIKGDAGTGKSQIARAAAAMLGSGWRFLYEVVTARLDAHDLQWRHDPIKRLALANLKDAGALNEVLEPGLLWRALAPASGQPRHAVVLIDEIDKADSDVPNSLLEVLANKAFTLPDGSRVPAQAAPDDKAVEMLVIFTSNDERELPPAFVRRCLVLDLKPPKTEVDFKHWLLERGQVQFPTMQSYVLDEAARLTWIERQGTPAAAVHRPGLAEFLDLLRGLQRLAPVDYVQQLRWLARLAPYALLKAGQDQSGGVQAPDPRALP